MCLLGEQLCGLVAMWSSSVAMWSSSVAFGAVLWPREAVLWPREAVQGCSGPSGVGASSPLLLAHGLLPQPPCRRLVWPSSHLSFCVKGISAASWVLMMHRANFKCFRFSLFLLMNLDYYLVCIWSNSAPPRIILDEGVASTDNFRRHSMFM